MKLRLEEIARRIEQEILKTGTVVVNGQPTIKTSTRNNLFAGLCHGAVSKVKELAPDLRVILTSFTYIGDTPWECGKHVIGVVVSPEGEYGIDPTIKQFIPDGKTVYSPNEIYPLRVAPGSFRRVEL